MICQPSKHQFGSFTSWSYWMIRPVSDEVKKMAEKLDCDRPNKLKCRLCFDEILIKCKALKEDKCVPCALRAKADKKLAMISGLMKAPMNWLEMTLTAGGIEGFPWDKSKCNHIPFVKCSGKIGCKADEVDSAVFNGQMPKNWNRFLQDARRLFGKDVQYCKVFEAQARDLLHIHTLITGAPAWPLKRINKELKRLAKRHGFGGQISVKRAVGDSPNDRQRAAGYVGKYLTKGSKTLKTVNFKTGEIRLGGYRDFTQSRSFGDTLKTIRRKRLEHYRTAILGERSGSVGNREAETALTTGAEGALDIYKKSYTLLE